jgi:hypothetical protein
MSVLINAYEAQTNSLTNLCSESNPNLNISYNIKYDAWSLPDKDTKEDEEEENNKS